MGNTQVYNKPKTVNNFPKYTTKRGETFYINFRLPSGKFFRQSLGSDSLKTVEATMSRLTPYISLVRSGEMSAEDFKLKIVDLKTLTKRDLDSLLYRLLETDLKEAERIPQLGSIMRPSGMQIANPAGEAETAKGYAGAVSDDLISGQPFSENLIKHMLKHEGFDPDSLPFDVMAAGSQWNMSRAQLYEAYQAFYAKDLPKYQQIIQGLKQGLPAVPAQTEPDLLEEGAEELSLSAAWEMFFKEKSIKWTSPIANGHQRYFDVLFAILGDKPITSITKQDMRHVWACVQSLPKRTIKNYKSYTEKELLEADAPESDLISSANAGKHWKTYRSFFNVYLKDEKDLLSISPLDGIKIDVKEKRYGNYTRAEMRKLVQYAVELPDTDQFKWILLLLCYTGARRSEICDLSAEQIRIDEETQRYYIMIASEGGKTEAALRQVPLSPKLIEWGFLKSIQGIKGNIFPAYATRKNNEKFTPLFREVRDKLKIPVLDDYGHRRIVHSIRHSGISEMLSITPNVVLVQQIVGHEHSQSLGITARYAHKMPVKDLLPVIDGLKWD